MESSSTPRTSGPALGRDDNRAEQTVAMTSDRGVKPGYLTSEFISSMIVAISVLVAGAATDNLQADEVWPIVAALSIGYMISRGLAKIGATGGRNV